MKPRQRSLRRYLPAVALTAVAAAIGVIRLLAPSEPMGEWWAFALAAGLGEVLLVESPRGRPVPTSVAVLAAFALLGNSPGLLAAVAVTGWLFGALVRLARRQHTSLRGVLHRVALAWSLSGLAAAAVLILPDANVGSADAPINALAVGLTSLALMIAGPVSVAVETAVDEGVPIRPVFLGQVRSTWRGSIALASSAVLAALAHGILGPGALVLMLLPVLAARAGMHRFTEVRRSYNQTIAAMSRITELTGHIELGHGPRVADLSIGVARELGLSDVDVEVVERTAFLHELGRLSTDDPTRTASDHAVAVAGAAIVREAGGMESVAGAIERHRDPYRRPGEAEDPTVPIAARIVRTVCEYDRAARREIVTGQAWEAVDDLRLRMAYDLDPNIIQALTRALERRGDL